MSVLMEGLYYCELHAASQVQLQDPEYRWKFNKARQGWLMRNVWNDTEVSKSSQGATACPVDRDILCKKRMLIPGTRGIL